MKTIAFLLVSICLLACKETNYEDVILEPDPIVPSATYHYYSHKASETIDAAKLGYAANEFTPGCTYVYGDTLFIANTQSGHFSVDLYSQSAHRKIGSVNSWTYKGDTQTFNNYVEAIAVSDGKLYLANIGSSIDVFDVRTLAFITRIGNRQWGQGNTQLFHTHAIAVTGNYIIVRTKNGLQVTLQSDVRAEKYQNIGYFTRGNLNGFDVNNSFAPHQMAVDSTGIVFLADFGESGNHKIHAIDTTLIRKGDNVVMTTDQTLNLDFNPQGIALYKEMIYLSGRDGSLRLYNRNKKTFLPPYRSVSGYTIKGAQKLSICGDRLWMTDISTKVVVGIDIFRNEIEEYVLHWKRLT